jgi:hypothetical protein
MTSLLLACTAPLQVRHLADGLHSLSLMPAAAECAPILARVLPLLAHGNYQAQVCILLSHLLPYHLDVKSPL